MGNLGGCSFQPPAVHETHDAPIAPSVPPPSALEILPLAQKETKVEPKPTKSL